MIYQSQMVSGGTGGWWYVGNLQYSQFTAKLCPDNFEERERERERLGWALLVLVASSVLDITFSREHLHHHPTAATKLF